MAIWFLRSQAVQNTRSAVFGLKTNYSTLLDRRDWGGSALILSKMTWEPFMSPFMPLQGPCFSVIVIACYSTSKYR